VRLRHRFARVGCGTLLLAFCAAGLTLVEASPALADTGWYPFAATPCIWSPYATSGPLPQGQLDYWCPGYDWGTVEVPAGTSTSAILTTAEVAGQLSPYNYGYRNCTDYVAWKLASLGVKPAQYGGRGYSALGNGKTWGTNAAAHGVVNNATPAVGSVAVDPDGEFGHVAFVTAWNGTDIKVSQYNYDEDGNYTTQTGTPAKLGFTSFDHFESYETTPVPTAGSWSDVTPTAKAQGDNMFKGVSCPAPGFCVAVGASVSSTGNERALVETYTGSTWTILRRLTAASEFSELDGVFCTSTTSCVAVGYSHPAKTGYATPLIATLSGSTWSVGSGATTQYNDSSLTGVSCTTQTYCVAVGTSVNNTESFTLIEVYKGKGWSLSTSPNPIGAHGQPENNLFGVACAGTTLCVAVGNDQTKKGPNMVLIDVLKGGKWANASVSNVYEDSLLAVSCPSTTFCMAVGDGKAVVEYNGTKWTSVQAASVAVNGGSQPPWLYGVSCTGPNVCAVSGLYFVSGGGTGEPVVETLTSSGWDVLPATIDPGYDNGYLFGVSCNQSAGSCLAVGSEVTHSPTIPGNMPFAEIGLLG